MTCCRSSTTCSAVASCIVTSSRTTWGSPSAVARARSGSSCLFDFSLAAEPLDAIDVGTRPYLDPFLGRGDRRTWDPAAERYAAAVTLYEMATARRPEYGAGAHPGFTDADATIEPELFDRSYAPGLAEFFRIALNRDAVQRYDTAEAMRRAWDAVFAQPSHSASRTRTRADHPGHPGRSSGAVPSGPGGAGATRCGNRGRGHRPVTCPGDLASRHRHGHQAEASRGAGQARRRR